MINKRIPPPPPLQIAQDELAMRRKSFALSADGIDVGDLRAIAPRTPESSRARERFEMITLHRSLSAEGLHTPMVCLLCTVCAWLCDAHFYQSYHIILQKVFDVLIEECIAVFRFGRLTQLWLTKLTRNRHEKAGRRVSPLLRPLLSVCWRLEVLVNVVLLNLV